MWRNGEPAAPNAPVGDDDEIAVLPPSRAAESRSGRAQARPSADRLSRHGRYPPALVSRVAVLSLHTSPLVLPGRGDAGGMNVYVRELVSSIAQAGIDATVFVRRHDDAPEVVDVEPGFRVVHMAAGPPRAAQGVAAVGRARVRRRREGVAGIEPCRRAARQLLAVGRGWPPAEARARPAAGDDVPHAGPGQGRHRRPEPQRRIDAEGGSGGLLRRDHRQLGHRDAAAWRPSTAPTPPASTWSRPESTGRCSRWDPSGGPGPRWGSATSPCCCSWAASSPSRAWTWPSRPWPGWADATAAPGSWWWGAPPVPTASRNWPASTRQWAAVA